MTSLATDGPAGGKLHLKLRTMLDAATGVNIMRAQQSGSVCVSAETLRANAIPPLDVAAPVTAGALSFDITDLTPLEAPPEAEFSTFIELRQDITAVEEGELTDLLRELGSGFSRKGNLIAADLAAGAVDRVQRLRAVSSIAPGEPLRLPLPKIGRSSDDLSREDLALDDLELPVNSAHVLIGIIDVGGFDFSHEDFRDGDRTRFWRIWDQAGTSRPGGPALNNLTDFTYGSEILQQHMNDAIAAEDQLGIAAYELEPQSVRTPGSHGTHVASIAAGNQGVCPQAHIAGVLLALGEGDTDARLSFYDSTRIAHAIEYLLAVAADLGEESEPAGRSPSRSTSAWARTVTPTTPRARSVAGSTTRSRRRGGA
jgi:subtilisin family serine protease